MNKQGKIIISVPLALALIAGLASQVNVKFDIIYPDPAFGRDNGLVLSYENYTKLQNNVGIFTVKNKQILTSGSPTFEQPTIGYCPLAKKIYESHLKPYPDITQKFEKYMWPDFCKPEIGEPTVIPEFGAIAVMILVIGVTSIIVLNKRFYNKV